MEEHVYPHMYRVEKEHWWFVARLKILLRFLSVRLHASSQTRILDVGCGTGAILEEFSRRYEAFGIDSSPQAVEFCRRRGLSNVSTGLLADFPSDRRFDLITMLDVVEHVDDDTGLLREARRRLTAAGHILIAVPAFPWLWSRHDDVLQHKRRYTRTSLGRVVTAAGFTIERMTYFNTLLFPLAVFRRFMAKVFNLPEMGDLEIPSRFTNSVLRRVFELEAGMLPSVSFPFGLSVLCLARSTGP